MPIYIVTEKAPPRIADKPHDGPGSAMVLTESQAKHELVLGHIVLHEASKPEEPVEEAPAKKGKG